MSKKWGPYVSDRQWGTVREDYSEHGTAWDHTTHDMARSKAWRWGEEGIAGISDDQQLLCFALALWNKKDPIIKERYFGLNSNEGNHGEDVKELYYYLDSTPTHSYMKMLYKYPQSAFPYADIVNVNRGRSKSEPEFELIDTGVFNDDRFFDVFVEYAKADAEDILIRITVYNRGDEDASLHVLPTLWFRNTWTWGYDTYKPSLTAIKKGSIAINHDELPGFALHYKDNARLLFCDNESNMQKLYNYSNEAPFQKDGVNEFLVNGNSTAINDDNFGTKVAVDYDITVAAHSSQVICLRLENKKNKSPFKDFDSVFAQRLADADAFYAELQGGITSEDEKLVQRQAFAGMLWSKQFFYFDVDKWLEGDPSQPKPPAGRKYGRNHEWKHLNNADIISMPDKWEYPWYAAWDLAFHCIPLSIVDSDFAKNQLQLITKEWYMHPNGQLPAYEWAFGDVNPPVHAWSAWEVYKTDQKNNGGKADLDFLESIFHKLVINFTWWVNRKDSEGNNIFEGGFLGLDNISVFDRSNALPAGGHIEQSDGTSWMAMYALNLMRISLELAKHRKIYADMSTKFFEHFLYIASAMAGMGDGLWDEEDQFFYDNLKFSHDNNIRLKVRSMVGLIPLFAVEVLDDEILTDHPEFAERLNWFLVNNPQLANLVSRWSDKGMGDKHLLSLLRGHRMKKILLRMLDGSEFLSDYGIRALSKFHEQNPYHFYLDGQDLQVDYTPGESTTGLFGGNSNWRGPIWMPVNYLLIESLHKFHAYYGPDFQVEHPVGSGNYLSLEDVANELSKRLAKLFLRDESGKRPFLGTNQYMQNSPLFNNYILFYEYFHGDTGRGVGASHQTGWTGLVAKLLHPKS
ncbi:MGH1-like glycoside hydrolase domain-containing protein [Mucilaginibacter ginsenosidivorans]|uniref:MGH1-like glycoside hydrolase domain-containing protein n=1 Tax=Mucilaginibacter ginsenosidivorans TaxID=398053 RepID=UPI00366E403D